MRPPFRILMGVIWSSGFFVAGCLGAAPDTTAMGNGDTVAEEDVTDQPRAAAVVAGTNMNCTIVVPANALTAQGLATPFQLKATDPAAGPCHEANPMQSAFVQGAVIDLATGQISVYNPLVIDAGTQPAAAPVVPKLPAQAVVALWFGFNGATLTLQGAQDGTLGQANCVNGARGTAFGQFAYCNARAFFAAANQLIADGKTVIPALGTALDGKTCPTVRDFSVVDMDQSDNVTTTYLVTAKGQIAQNNAANAAALANAVTQVNGSDNRLLAVALDGALGCQPAVAPDLADPGKMVPALPLNELQAARDQLPPMAIVPAGDPMVLVNAAASLTKQNAYRAGVNQPLLDAALADNTKTYCQNMLAIAPARLNLDMPLTMNRPSPDPAAANNLFTFLAQRFSTAFGANGLNCTGLLNAANPVTLTLDGNGVAIAATIKAPAPM